MTVLVDIKPSIMADRDEVMRDDGGDSGNKRRRQRSRSAELRDDGRPKRRRSLSPRDRRGDRWYDGGGGGFRSDGYYNDYSGNPYWNDGYDSRGYNNSPSRVPDPHKLDYLVSFKHFSDYERDRGGRRADETEMRRRYDIYKEQYHRKATQKFYDQHKNEEWFYEKYNTALSGPFRQKVKDRKQEIYIKEDYHRPDEKPDFGPDGDVAVKDATGTPATAATPTTAASSSTWPDVQVADPRAGLSVFIRSVPGNFKRAEIEDVLKTYPGFKCLELSDPNPQKRFSRFGWVVLKDGFDPEDAVKVLSNKKIVKLPTDVVENTEQTPDQPSPITEFALQVNVSAAHTNKPRIIPIETNNLKRMEEDMKIAHDLAKEVDGEVGWRPEEGEGAAIVVNRLSTVLGPESSDADSEIRLVRVKKDLDLHIEYLKRVHFYDFYSCIECDSPEDFLRRVPVSVRQASQPNSNPEAPQLQRFLERLDLRHYHRIHKPLESEMIRGAGGKDIESEIDKAMDSHIGKVDDGKFRCLVCTKLFKGEDFVRKHIRSKHPELVDKLRVDFVIINNYCRDPNRVHDMQAPEPVVQRFMGPPPPPGYYGNNNNQFWDAPNGGNEGGGGFFDQAYSGGGTPRGRGGMRGRFMDGGRGRGRGRGRGMPMELGPPPAPPAGAYVDPRQRLSYVDLDAPATGGPDVDVLSYD
ncbi:hypothetical protein SeMB42_g00455 [Synchytrium endobioticum]|uniref:C2H2-type domain-containing protein n=1 Tax=Synchytrium endobioticum TaxID=286115 RepID=A0A507DRC1_9FUNG|nr:hypothetical protein SeMB42_g00455 [Synchytrium endobioticum]